MAGFEPETLRLACQPLTHNANLGPYYFISLTHYYTFTHNANLGPYSLTHYYTGQPLTHNADLLFGHGWVLYVHGLNIVTGLTSCLSLLHVVFMTEFTLLQLQYNQEYIREKYIQENNRYIG